MVKYLMLSIAVFLIIGCGAKATTEKVKPQTKQTISKEVVKVKKAPKRVSLPEGFKEVKKLRAMDNNVPSTCQEWSDGCNICTRAGNNQASCTIYTCEEKAKFSCLKWQ